MNKCKVCGKNSVGEYCFSHKPRKAIPRSSKITVDPIVAKKIQDDFLNCVSNSSIHAPNHVSYGSKAKARHLLFLEIWKKREHVSEVSGTYLGPEPLSIFFHHILPKSKYPQGDLDEENIVILTGDEHTNVENDMYKYEEVNKRRESLKRKYGL